MSDDKEEKQMDAEAAADASNEEKKTDKTAKSNTDSDTEAAEANAEDSKAAKKQEKADKRAEKKAAKAREKAARAKAVDKTKAARAKGGAPQGLKMPVAVVLIVVALVGGALLGHFVWPGGAGGSLGGKTTISEGELDSVVGTYTYDGQTHNITARDAIEQSSSLDSAKNKDGSYTMPSADAVLSLARNEIIEKAADDEGIKVSDDDLKSYAEENLGTSDFDSIASSYGMDADTVKNLIRQSAKMSKLRDKKVDSSDLGDAPAEPSKVDDKDSDDTERKEYADYIIKLAGDEWDSDKGTWKSSDGDYATALADYKVTKDSASYGAAQAAYYVAYQQYSTKQSEVTKKWTDYVNGLLCNATISISNLYA